MFTAPTGTPLYTKEHDGTVQRWYLFGWYGDTFSVAPRKNAKLRDYKRYYSAADIGQTIYKTRKEATAAPRPAAVYQPR